MKIEIIRVDGALRVNPAPPYLTTYLQYTHRSFARKAWKMVNHFEKKLLYSPHPVEGIITFQGFFDKIVSIVTRQGDEVVVVDHRTPVNDPDLQAVKDINWEGINSTGLRDYQVDPVVEFLYKAKEGSGIANCTGGWGKSALQAVTYAAFNQLKHTILAIPLKEVFNQTYNTFCKLFPDKHVGRVGGGYNDISEDITITTFKSLPKCALEKCQLLLVDELQGSTGEKILETLMSVQPIRIFGYTATDQNLFNNADKLLKGLFGERLIYIPYKEGEESGAVVPCKVYMVKMPETAFIDANTIEAKISRGIKNNEIRNKLIGSICASVPNNWQTLVFVDHIEDHLVNLYKHMPRGTKFLHRGTSKKELGSFALSNKQQDEIIEAFKSNEIQYLIGTDAFRAGVDIPNCRVVVQGAGGTSVVEILQEALRGSRTLPERLRQELGVDEKKFMVLIDILDQHNSTLENMSLSRMDTYRKQGWSIKVVDKVEDIDWLNPIPEKKL
ncbi:conserved hypothetical protein [Gammaproteobacteria bacterium]